MTRAVFLDRDGVINASVVRDGKPYPPDSVATMTVLPGVVEAVTRLKAAGFRVVVVTNQPDVGAGRQRREVVDAIHTHLSALMPLDDVRVCCHTEADACLCRKPKPGMLLAAAAESAIDLPRSFMVGDRWRDIDAGRAAGCRTVLVGGGYEERSAEGYDVAVASLFEASKWILAQQD